MQSERYFNSKVKERMFKEGYLVLRKVLPNTKEVNTGVLGPIWKAHISLQMSYSLGPIE